MYSLNTNVVKVGRLELFEKACSNKHQSAAILKKQSKGLDAPDMPPAKEELFRQIKRTNTYSYF